MYICSIGNSMPGSGELLQRLILYRTPSPIWFRDSPPLISFQLLRYEPKKGYKVQASAHRHRHQMCTGFHISILFFVFVFCLDEFSLLWVERRTSCFFIRKAFRNRFSCVSLNPGSDLNIHFPICLNNLRY